MQAVPNIVVKKNNFNDAYISILHNLSRYLVLYGGSSSGKSYSIVERYIYRIMNEKPMNLVVVRNVAKDNRDSTFPLFKQVMSKWHASGFFKINEGDMRITCLKNGNMIVFKGLDDVENIKSTTFPNGEMTDIWIEEANQTSEDDFTELDRRLRGGKSNKQITISFNPVSAQHWLKSKFYDKSNGSKCDTYVHSEGIVEDRLVKLYCTILKTTYKDNRFLGDSEKALLESYKDTDPYYYEVYCLGNWGIWGASIFDKNKVNDRINQIQSIKPFMQGYFEYELDSREHVIDSSIRFVESRTGCARIYEDVKKGYPYVLGGDTSGEGSDYFVNQVIDNTTGKQVATLRQHFDEDLYSKQTYCMGIYFNKALLGLETNFSTYPVKELERLEYPNQYFRETEDNYTHKPMKSYGFQTNKKTRPQLIAILVEEVRESVNQFNDLDTLNEMLTFIRNEKGRPEAAENGHDDCIMSMGITYYIRNQQSFRVMQTPQNGFKWLVDELNPKVQAKM